MTFSIAARCPRTGMVGAAVSSSSICVAGRCLFVRAEVGAAVSQNVTDPALGPRLLARLAEGASASGAIEAVIAEAPGSAWRQLLAVDRDGGTGHFSGARALGRHGAATGEACVAAGNLLAHEAVPEDMVGAFVASDGHLAERLLGALEAGVAAGGEQGPVRSAGMLVADGRKVSWPVVDLRVDWDEAPVAALRRIWELYEPQLEAFVMRALDPEAAPPFAAPGER